MNQTHTQRLAPGDYKAQFSDRMEGRIRRQERKGVRSAKTSYLTGGL